MCVPYGPLFGTFNDVGRQEVRLLATRSYLLHSRLLLGDIKVIDLQYAHRLQKSIFVRCSRTSSIRMSPCATSTSSQTTALC